MEQIRTAVIMAAGMGTRFGHHTEKLPKGFVDAGGKPMIIRSIETLLSCGIQRIIIGTGYLHEAYDRLVADYPQIECCYSPLFAETNSMYTLYNCRDVIGDDDFLLLESDLVFEARAISSLIACPHPDVMLIAPVTKFQDQYYVERNSDNILTACSVNEADLNPSGELVGIHRLSSAFYKKMCADYEAKLTTSMKMGYEYQLLHMSRHIAPVYVLREDNLLWYEIDDPDDLAYAEANVINKLDI